MKAFHGDQARKDFYIARVKSHRDADEIRHGFYWEKREGTFKGCAVGCTLHSGKHYAYELELGVPRLLARLEDRIFEGLPSPYDKDWPLRFLEAIKPGADLSEVWTRFAIWMLSDPEHGTMRLCRPDGAKATKAIVALFERKLAGDNPTADEWYRARKLADAADAAAAYAAAAADAAYAAAYAADAADAAAAAAADAAYAAAYAAAYDAYAAAADADAAAADAADAAAAASLKYYIVMSEKLLELLGACEVISK